MALRVPVSCTLDTTSNESIVTTSSAHYGRHVTESKRAGHPVVMGGGAEGRYDSKKKDKKEQSHTYVASGSGHTQSACWPGAGDAVAW